MQKLVRQLFGIDILMVTVDISFSNKATSRLHDFDVPPIASIEAFSFADHTAFSSSISKRASVSCCSLKGNKRSS